MKTHKIKKSKRKRGTTTYHGARKKWKGSGHHGGCGMAGSGKRADHKKSRIINLYGNNYFGKQGVTSRGTKRNKKDVINLDDIEKNLDSLMKKFGNGKELVLKGYKVLGDGELKKSVVIKAKAFSESAKEKIEKAGGKAELLKDAGKNLKSSDENSKISKVEKLKTAHKPDTKEKEKKSSEKKSKKSIKEKFNNILCN